MTSVGPMQFTDVLAVFVVFLGLFIESIQYSGYISIIGFIIEDNFSIALLFSCTAFGYLVSINVSYQLSILFGYFIPMLLGSLISIWFTLLFAWNLHNYSILIICRIMTGIGTTLISTSGWVYILYLNRTATGSDNMKNNYSLRNFIANISYLSVSIAWIIGPLLSTFLYSFDLMPSILPFYAFAGVMSLHLALFLLMSIISCTKSRNKKIFCLKRCCICCHCSIACKHIHICPFHVGCLLKRNCCHHLNCPSLLNRSRFKNR